MILETERLLIREITEDDYAAIHRYASDPIVSKFMIWGPNTEEETRAHIERTIEMRKQQPRVSYEWAVELKDSRELIGGCGIHVVDPLQGEIGYCFNPLYWRKGYASESSKAMLKFGFKSLGLHRIYATCRPENISSANVMKSVGMQYEGHLRGHMWHKGQWHDSFQYSILEHEYEGI